MHENREISCASWSNDQDRSVKAINHNADVNVQEKSDCGVVPLSRPNNEGQPSAEVGEARAQTEENMVRSHMPPTQSGTRHRRVDSAGIFRRSFPNARALWTSTPTHKLPKNATKSAFS